MITFDLALIWFKLVPADIGFHLLRRRNGDRLLGLS